MNGSAAAKKQMRTLGYVNNFSHIVLDAQQAAEVSS